MHLDTAKYYVIAVAPSGEMACSGTETKEQAQKTIETLTGVGYTCYLGKRLLFKLPIKPKGITFHKIS